MLFSYCKRTSNNEHTHVPYVYKMSPLQTIQGFNKLPAYCQGLNVPYVANRGLPRNLIERETELRGQGKIYQPYCANTTEKGDLQFSMFDYLQNMPYPHKAPIPCVPTPVVQMSPSGGSPCSHSHITTRCGRSCACSLSCQCKIQSLERNVTRPQVGGVGLRTEPVCRFK
jgi:hypothetical protein